MIVKPRKYPRILKQLEALQRRLPQNHPKFERVKENYAKRLAGYKGEQNLDYSLSFIDDENYLIFHDVRIFDGTQYFQIDTLILSRQFILILEVKNISGTLFFDTDFNQLIRIQDGKREAFPDPILQVKRQTIQFRKWLNKNKFKNIPIESLIVISTPRTILETSPQNQFIYTKVIHSTKLPFTVSSIEKSHETPIFTKKQLLQLSREILEQHIPLNTNILSQYELTKEELLKGVICPNCQHLPTVLNRGKWTCFNCHSEKKGTHLSALEDYALLLGSTITNKQIRDFLIIPTTKKANRILASLDLESRGKNRWKVYDLKNEK